MHKRERQHREITTQDIAPLLVCLQSEEADVRSAAISALVRLPLERDAWGEVSDVVRSVIREHGPQESFVLAMTRIPVREVRSYLHWLLENGPEELRSPLVHALAEVHDDHGAPLLMRELQSESEHQRMQAAESLARCGTTDLGPEAWEAAKHDPIDDVRFFVSMARARSGDVEPLKEIVSRMTTEPGLDLRFARGDPMEAQSLLQSIPPLPDSAAGVILDAARDSDAGLLHDLADAQRRGRGGTRSEDGAEERTAPAPETDPELPARRARAQEMVRVCIERGIFAKAPQVQETDWEDRQRITSGLRENFPYLSADEAAAFIARAFAEIDVGDIGAGNELVTLVIAMGDRFEPDVSALFQVYRTLPASSVRWQVAWVASRRILPEVIGAVADVLLHGTAAERVTAAGFTQDAARYARQSYAPIFGGGTGPADTPMPDDLMTFTYAAAHRSARPAPESGGEAAGEGAPREPEKPAKVYARLDCEEVVKAGTEFELVVGIAPQQTTDVMGEALEGLAGKRNYFLIVHVVAEGFSLRQGESWRNTLAVTDDQPYPITTLHLVAEPPQNSVEPRLVQATYSADGQVAGVAFRAVAVLSEGSTLAPPAPEQPRGRDIVIPASPVPPDLTVIFHRARDPRKLRLTLESPHEDVVLPDEDLEVDIGEEPAEYAKGLVQTMNVLEGKKRLYRTLLGNGRTLSQMLPQEFWSALRQVSDRASERPTVLLLSEDPYVPWELAVVEPPLDPSAAPFLSAQLVVGRWVLGNVALPPPHEMAVQTMAAVAGDYRNLPRWENLEAAFEERQNLKERWSAEMVEGTYADVIELLERQPCPSIVHLALHGKFSPQSVDEGLVLVDGEWLSPDVVRGTSIHGQPFVFLNACQVGSASEVLGQYAGMAAAFLMQGAAAVVAPLWSVKDGIARTLALSFYDRTLKDGVSAGEAIRAERAKFQEAGGSDEAGLSSTLIAYQYFGHPALRLVRKQDGSE